MSHALLPRCVVHWLRAYTGALRSRVESSPPKAIMMKKGSSSNNGRGATELFPSNSSSTMKLGNMLSEMAETKSGRESQREAKIDEMFDEVHPSASG